MKSLHDARGEFRAARRRLDRARRRGELDSDRERHDRLEAELAEKSTVFNEMKIYAMKPVVWWRAGSEGLEDVLAEHRPMSPGGKT